MSKKFFIPILIFFIVLSLVILPLALSKYTKNFNKPLNINVSSPTYTVTFDYNDGVTQSTTKEVTYNYPYGILPEPTKTGYTFMGWYTAASGGTQITSSTTVTQTSNHTLIAIWQANTYEVIFNKNDNNATGTMTNQTMTYDVANSLTTNRFTKTGYKFMGWNTSADGTGTSYTDGQTVTNLKTSGTITLYAQWMRVMAENVEHIESELNCTDTQCMIDELYYMLY